MRTVQVRDAKAGLSALLEDAENGRPTTITRHGKPVAVLVPIEDADRLYAGRQSRSLVELLMAFPGGLDVERDRTPLREIEL